MSCCRVVHQQQHLASRTVTPLLRTPAAFASLSSVLAPATRSISILASSSCKTSFSNAHPALGQARGVVRMPLENWKLSKSYVELGNAAKRVDFVPKPRGQFQDPATFLTAIGRSCGDYAPKFNSWAHLFQATSDEMATSLGIPTKARKYILGWREWFKRGRDPYVVPVAKRAKKYLKLRAKVKLERLKREGKA
ncbi:hypothetical protein HDU67_004270 [Dinochytrium kinnereticum]|nr:hypothetical protein HDU67_004270 [Dinochytrium kinnereticum]